MMKQYTFKTFLTSKTNASHDLFQQLVVCEEFVRKIVIMKFWISIVFYIIQLLEIQD